MKTFEQVKNEMDEDFRDCLMTMEDFLENMECGGLTPYDGVGDIHDGDKFITDGFEKDIFNFIYEKAPTMTKEEFIAKYPYVAWFNK